MSARARLAVLVGTVAVVVAGVAVVVGRGGDDGPDPAVDARAYLAAWQEGDTAALEALVADPADSFAADLAAISEGLRVVEARYELGDVERDGDQATAAFTATLGLAGLGDWRYDGTLPLVRAGEGDNGDGGDKADGGGWLVDWSPAAVHPGLVDGQRLVRTREQPERAPIVDAAGEPLVEARPAVTVGVQPSRVDDRAQVKQALQRHLDVDPARVDTELDRPGVEPDHFVPIVTVPEDRYEQVRAEIYEVPGLVFQETTERAGPTDDFARHTLGRTGEITAELLDQLGPAYQAGDRVGLSGLEGRYEAQLAGTPSGEVQIVDDADAVVSVLHTVEGTEPRPVETTLDPAVQAAVEAALDDDQPAAVVAVDRDGNVRAMASRPLDEGLNRAIGGSYPPGSTFKVVSTSAFLSAGVTPETPVECPETIDAGGRSFKNFESSSLGTVSFGTAFAESCNTAMIGVSADIPDADLVAAAERFGFNTDYTVGLRTLTPRFPTPADATEHAAATIGQGRVVATPLHMATVGAAVIDGTWEPPTLVRGDPAPATDDESADQEGEQPGGDGDGTANGGTDGTDQDADTTTSAAEDGDDAGTGEAGTTPAAEARSLPDGQAATLQGLMRRVVTEGSGTAAAVPGVEVLGKTGTAEFGTGDPLPTHAWFIGVRGDLAVAVLVEDGGVGGEVAAPLAGTILAALPGG